MQCTSALQSSITAFLSACAGKTECKPGGKGLKQEWDQSSVRYLQKTGPSDCDYSLGFEGCNSTCSMAQFSSFSGGTSALEQNGCLSSFSSLSPVVTYKSCSPSCSKILATLSTTCASCETNDPYLHTFLRTANAFSATCATHNLACNSVSQDIQAACCPIGQACKTTMLSGQTWRIPGNTTQCSGTCKAQVQKSAGQCPSFFARVGQQYAYAMMYTGVCSQTAIPVNPPAMPSAKPNAAPTTRKKAHKSVNIAWAVVFGCACSHPSTSPRPGPTSHTRLPRGRSFGAVPLLLPGLHRCRVSRVCCPRPCRAHARGAAQPSHHTSLGAARLSHSAFAALSSACC